MIYIISCSAFYYPVAGTGDWETVTTDRKEAEDEFYALEPENCESIHLIEIDADTGEYRTLDTRQRGYV